MLWLFRNGLNNFNKTRARMLSFTYQMTKNYLKSHIFCVQTSRFCNLSRYVIIDVIMLRF